VLLPLALCAAFALLAGVLFPGCLNPRPEEDPSVNAGVGVSMPDGTESGSSGGAGGSGSGRDLDADPVDQEGAQPPASQEPDAGVPRDAGVPPPPDGSTPD
jgi:hypothetical protein